MNNILETVYKQRKYDGKWMALGRIKDLKNSYIYTNDSKQKITLVPDTWIITGIYDYELQFVK